MTEVSNEYAKALFSLACEQKCEKQILGDMRKLSVFSGENADYIKLMSAPNIKKAERCSLLDEAFRNNIHQYTLNFLKILIERDYFRFLGDCCEAYINLYNEANGIIVVTAVSCIELSESQKERLCSNLSKKLGKNIELHTRIDPSLLGGVRLELPSEMIDASIKSRIDEIASILNSTVI